MTVNYEPFGVYVVVEVDDRIVVVNDNKSIHLPFDYGIRGDTPQKCAKRKDGLRDASLSLSMPSPVLLVPSWILCHLIIYSRKKNL